MTSKRNSLDASSNRDSKQSIESYKNETETTTTEVAIIGFEEKPIESSGDSATPVSQKHCLVHALYIHA